MQKIINVSQEPYEFTFDGGHYGPMKPGEIMDLPDEIAAHAIRRSEAIDPDFGTVVGYRAEYLNDVARDKDRIKQLATYPCPYAHTAQCSAEPFRKPEDLKAHMESAHWGDPKKKSA